MPGVPPPSGLLAFYLKKKRVDAKEVILTLAKETFKLYFETVVGEGKLDRDRHE